MPIQTQPYPGAAGGMRPGIPAYELEDNECQYIQDGLINQPGLTVQRGPLQTVAGFVAFSYKGTGIVSALNPVGAMRFAVLNGDATHGLLSLLSDDNSAKVDYTWPHFLPTTPDSGAATAYRYYVANAALGGGALIGVSDKFDSSSPQQSLAYWVGGNKADYTNNVTFATGSRAVTGTGLTAVVPGMFLFANTDDAYTAAYIGCVATVNSSTSITLQQPSPYFGTAQSGTFKSVRGVCPRVAKGRITCATDSATVNGGDTKFLKQKLNTGTWHIYRRHDMAKVGKVSSVQSDISLTLTANAAVACANHGYVAIQVDGDFTLPLTDARVGWITSVYANRQWYFNLGTKPEKTYRAVFSDELDFEALDLAEDDGDWFSINSTGTVQEPTRGVCTVLNGMVVCKESETFLISGQDPTTFRVDKIWGDGCLSPMSVQPYGGGALWAGREGIHFFDGQQVSNLIVDKFGDVWKNSLRTFDSTKYRMWSAIVHNHYLLFIEKMQPSISVIKGNVSSTPSYWTIMVNLENAAMTLHTGLRLRGMVHQSPSEFYDTWLLVNSATAAKIVLGDAIFESEGLDQFEPDGEPIGPDFFMESKKFDWDDPLRLKRIKQIAVNYLVQGGDIYIDTVLNLNNVAKTLTSTLPESVYTWDRLRTDIATWDAVGEQFSTWSLLIKSIFLPKRVRFLKRGQFFSFRLYTLPDAITGDAEVSRLRLGPFHIGYKWMRPGRV